MADQPSTDRRLFAHIVHPSSKMREVLDGNKRKVKALCGVMVARSAPNGAPVCRGCFDQYLVIGEPEDQVVASPREPVPA